MLCPQFRGRNFGDLKMSTDNCYNLIRSNYKIVETYFLHDKVCHVGGNMSKESYCKPINPKATLVALNYNFSSIPEFIDKLKAKNILEKYSLKQENQKIQITGNIPPAPVINDLRNFLPLTFISADTTVKIIYTQQELKLVIAKENILENNFQEYKNLSYDFIDFKISDINAIGMNYSAQFNLGKEKLLLLSQETVSAVPTFDKNISFEFILPLKDDTKGVLSTYRVKKVSEETAQEHIYEISVNFHYDISQLSTMDKTNKLNEIISLNSYKEFEAQCNRFLGVKHGIPKE